ncbi:hypothetical protein K449DRAFT_459855 [Hypoxylon sp. EC38]|nr:hypothetical protein K449DRAFT_459855 [Hypoxylon sp. EC38]
MQILKPLFALLCAQLAVSSPIATNEDLSVGLVERTDSIERSAALKVWDQQSGVPGHDLKEGLHIFKAKYARDEVADQGMADIITDARNFLNANHYVLVSVEVKKKTTTSGPKGGRKGGKKGGKKGGDGETKTEMDVGEVRFFDIAVDTKNNNQMVMHKQGAPYNMDRAVADHVEHQYLKQLRVTRTFSQINRKAQDYIEDHPTYNAQTNNCMSFVDGLAADLR